MKRAWSVTMAAAVLLGCRTSQPTTNPFLRTAVPPPSTGAGAVVVPGEQYYPGAPPPVAGAPVVAPTVPVTQVPAAPPPVITTPIAPQPVMPPRDKFSPPGGSFQYNQSSLDHPPSVDPNQPREQRVEVGWTKSANQPWGTQLAASIEEDLPAAADKAATGGVSTAAYQTKSTRSAAARADARVEPPEDADVAVDAPAVRNQLRIVEQGGENEVADAAEVVDRPSTKPAFRVTVGGDQPLRITGGSAFRDVTPTRTADTDSQVSIVTPDTVADATEALRIKSAAAHSTAN